MNLKGATALGVLLGAAALGIGLVAWPHLPDPMPIHWDRHGQPNGYGSRALGVLLMPALIAGMGVFFAALAKASPAGYRLDRFEGTVAQFAAATEALLFTVQVEALGAAATGRPLSVGLLGFGIGALLLVLGNRMGKVRRNFFIGVRTPWTLADEEVWARTHRLAGKLFVAAGLLTMALSALGGPPLWLPPVVLAGLVPVVYSYLVYRRLHPPARL